MNTSFLNIGRIFSKTKKVDENSFYTSLKSIPIAVWDEVTHKGTYEKLIISGNVPNYLLYSAYLDMLQEYHDEFGNSEKHEEFIKARFNYAKALSKWVQTQDSFDKMMLEMAEIDLKELTPKKDDDEKEQTLSESMAIIEYEFGPLDENVLTAHKYYSYHRHLRKKAEQQVQAVKSWQKR